MCFYLLITFVVKERLENHDFEYKSVEVLLGFGFFFWGGCLVFKLPRLREESIQ